MSTIYFKEEVPYWCATDKPIGTSLSNLPWLSSEPDNLFPPETVMVYYYLSSAYGVADGNSMMPWLYVCQWP